MTVRSIPPRRGWSRAAVLLVLCGALVPLPVVAAEGSASASPPLRLAATSPAPSLNAAVAKAVEREVAAQPTATARRSTQSTPGATPSFFKTPAGIAVLAVFAAGVGYAIYSTQNDRINSPGKE